LIEISFLIYYPRKAQASQDIRDAPATLIPKINLSQKTQFILAPIPKKTRQSIYPESGFEARYERVTSF